MAKKTIFLKEGVVEHYLENKSIYETAEKFGYKTITLYRLLKDNGIDTRLDKEKHRKRLIRYPINEDFFEKIDTRDKAYILGIISSDGHLFKNRKQLRIKLTDINILEEICKRVDYKKPLLCNKKYSPTHKDSKSLIICNTKIYNDLLAAGIPQNKSYTNTFPKIGRRLIPDFIRGFFDGNGSITICRSRLGNPIGSVDITSTLIFCNQLKEILYKLGIHSVVSHRKRYDERIGEIRIRRVIDVVLFYYLIYRDIEGQIFLRRKKDKYFLFIKEREGNIGSKHGCTIRFDSININKYDKLSA